MDCFEYGWVSRQSLQYRLERDPPRNEDSRSGFALVFVQGPESFSKAHIPLSVNIPRGREHEFERRFSKGKEIVLYGEDRCSWVVPMVAATLLHRGFSRIYVYEGGLRDWRAGGGPVARGPDRVRPGRPAAREPGSGGWHKFQAPAQDLQ